MCKGTYASVPLHRLTYGNYRLTVANVDESDSRCRCVCRIITRDLWLVASGLFRMTVTQPWVTCCRYIIPHFTHRPPGLHKPYKTKGKKKGKDALNNPAAYVLVRTHKSHNRSVPLRVTFRRMRRTGTLHLHLAVIQRWSKLVPTSFVLGRDPKK
jgi:hypothetical protein